MLIFCLCPDCVLLFSAVISQSLQTRIAMGVVNNSLIVIIASETMHKPGHFETEMVPKTGVSKEKDPQFFPRAHCKPPGPPA